MLNILVNLATAIISPAVAFLFFLSGVICVFVSFVLKRDEFKKEGKLSLFMGLFYVGSGLAMLIVSFLI